MMEPHFDIAHREIANVAGVDLLFMMEPHFDVAHREIADVAGINLPVMIEPHFDIAHREIADVAGVDPAWLRLILAFLPDQIWSNLKR